MTDYEKLGVFYLGRRFDQSTAEVTDEPILYDSRDLTTHAVCVGMTGSGKTGLCVGLLEEAILDGVPVLAIDPKGDLGNLLLTFPKLQAADFEPWIDPAEAARKGRSAPEHAAATAKQWREGLQSWGQDGDRIRRFRQNAQATIYTPGSNSGVPLAVLDSFAAPKAELDEDALRDRVSSAVSGLLALLGIQADPLRSREHILLATILDRAWREGRSLGLPSLIREIQKPPFERVGIFDLESFYPSDDRFELAMTLNNLLASPGFSAWAEGEPLDVQRLLFGSDGSARLSILSIAHLSDAERMFFVTLLLNEVIAWMRTQSGTSSLRAILYMDEVFGYFPPTANPPSKIPMLTLLKQARAYGLGVVLATQNPVDLDYKGLSNTGTWLLGRLQTERDKNRVLDGLQGASGEFDRSRMEKLLSGLQSRVFLMHNVHEDQPVLLHSRWALSYLRGPLTREQIKTLTHETTEPGQLATAQVTDKPAAERPQERPEAQQPSPSSDHGARPILPEGVEEVFLFLSSGAAAAAGNRTPRYVPTLLGRGTLHYAHSSSNTDCWQSVSLLVDLDDAGRADWEQAQTQVDSTIDFSREPDAGFVFANCGALPQPKALATAAKKLQTHLYKTHSLKLWTCKEPRLTSRAGQSEGDFRAELREAAREKRDLAVAKLGQKYASKLERARDAILRAQERVEEQQAQLEQQKMSTAVSVGSTLLGALFGRRLRSTGTVTSASTAMRAAGRVRREKGDVVRAAERVEEAEQKLVKLQDRFQSDLDELETTIDPGAFRLEEVVIRPRKSDLAIEPVLLAWRPVL